MTFFWRNKKVLVSGGAGFIGGFVSQKLVRLGANVTIMNRNIDDDEVPSGCAVFRGDCSDIQDACKSCRGKEIVLNLAAHIAGIQYNRSHQATMFRDNLAIITSMLEAARICKVNRFLTVSSACVYPHDAVIPTPESEGMRGEPEPTNGGYGWAKRTSEILSKYYANEFGLSIGIVRPYNAYGPRDHFDELSSHVIPALIKRIFSGENPLVVWGSGKQTRSFLYVEDLAEGLVRAIEKYPVPDPVNLGSDEEITIKDLVFLILKITGIKTRVVFDSTKPDGSPKRKSNNVKAKNKLGFMAVTPLSIGLDKTIKWYFKYYLSAKNGPKRSK